MTSLPCYPMLKHAHNGSADYRERGCYCKVLAIGDECDDAIWMVTWIFLVLPHEHLVVAEYAS